MSIATNISRLDGAKADLKQWLIAKGVSVPDNALIDGIVALLEGATAITNTSDANATAETILKGHTAYVNGVKITGTFVPEDVTAEVEAQTPLIEEIDTLLASKAIPSLIDGGNFTDADTETIEGGTF